MIFTEQIFRNSPPGDKVVVWVLFKKHVTKNLEHSVSFKVSEQNQKPARVFEKLSLVFVF